jgi:hypothetical protein
VPKPQTRPAPEVKAVDPPPAVKSLLRAPVAAAAASLARKIQIGQILADSGTIGKLGVGQVALGETTIKNVVLENTTAAIQGGKALLRNVRLLLELKLRLDWRVGVTILGHGFSRQGSDDLGSLTFPLAVGDVEVPALRNLDLQVPSLTASGLKGTLAPITGLALGKADLKKLEADATDLPADGFALSGLGFGSLQMSEIQVPKTSTATVSLEEMQLETDVVLPAAEISNLRMPAAAAGDITSQALSFDAVPGARSLSADFGVVSVKLTVQPVAHTMIDAMVIQDVKLAAAIGKLRIEEIRVPVKILGITLQQITLEGVKVAKVSL